VLKQSGNLLLLDEPTNDLDVDTLRCLEVGGLCCGCAGLCCAWAVPARVLRCLHAAAVLAPTCLLPDPLQWPRSPEPRCYLTSLFICLHLPS
jgi:hypothetical protein